ncbi:murein hydrolase activator EnvC [Planomicrobium sp. CPCC 101079]|uniref:murein hydrolase activator EnvC family protein n=1 Tax=Planomicrobium sp. CPCC 101079 TaxID=2599618 RepID=UPI0011B38D3B|nr:peptidoglycan DD-metalloendopeptidase family protein [Planomicrobium sp. CPCC 101079]TWT04882.1 peptidoglycan DD-metalloendopeptidase family protein [Planomicrobium sp. CPCC 101079]
MSTKSKWMLSGISSVLALTILMPTVANADKLSDLEQKQQEALQQKNELTSDISKKNEKMTENASKLEKLMAKIEDLNRKIEETTAKIDSVQADIDYTKAEIDELKKSIEELERKIAEREALLEERARAIQKSGGSVDYVDVLLGANNFVDFIDRFSAVNTLIEADREIMREQAADKKLLAEQKAQVETKLAEQEQRRAELVALNDKLNGQKKEQAGFVEELKAEQKRLAKEKSKLVQQRNEAINVSSKLEKQIEKEQNRLAELARKAEAERQRKLAAERKAAAQKARASNSMSSYTAPAKVSSSGFITPTSGRFTSKFGWRNIGDGPEFHQGVDIANSVGTNVKAAASGYVSFSGSMGGYGNVVILTHSINGQTHATVYAHLNSIDVSAGQEVSQGQRVGGMGNTGRSTGSHLHFEIHVGPWNGARTNAVNPASFVSL